MKLKNDEDQTKHGIVRGIQNKTGIFEATFKKGKAHGLYRLIQGSKITIHLYKDGECLS